MGRTDFSVRSGFRYCYLCSYSFTVPVPVSQFRFLLLDTRVSVQGFQGVICIFLIVLLVTKYKSLGSFGIFSFGPTLVLKSRPLTTSNQHGSIKIDECLVSGLALFHKVNYDKPVKQHSAKNRLTILASFSVI